MLQAGYNVPLCEQDAASDIDSSVVTAVWLNVAVGTDDDSRHDADLRESNVGLSTDSEQEPLHLQPARLCARHARCSAGAGRAND